MKLQVLLYCLGLALIAPAVHAEETPDAIVAFTEELVLPELELERPSTSWGSPLTLMQWSYGDGADNSGITKPIETDRPYFTKTASVVGRSNWQLESGIGYVGLNGRNGDVISSPEALLRVGALAEWFELRVGYNRVQWVRGHGRNGTSDSYPYAGAKIALTPQDEMLPETAVVLDLNFDSKIGNALSLNELQWGADFIYRWDLTNGVRMGGATEFHRVVAHNDPFMLFAQSWIFERSFTERVTGFAEWYLIAPDTGRRARTEYYLDAGLLYLLTDNIQLDASAGIGLNSAASDFFVGSGISVRW